ncbi:hypothetical protein HXZ94_14920 [Empedobacter falsenii]|uniref:hypothetical protein n=1 Tax=Empedobacter falsenii TaxID=343874 RepID=UPI002574CD76|nr:hypothetical protein [Empedobacter falsenii]MDM1299787.1 hypothetical protein [Empedobacter falsenii]MDM1319580.1 hypothetical protein [Empedobacter falsenii]
MSIVIVTLEENNCVNLFADRRLVKENIKSNSFTEDEIQKIFELTDTISCGMTGDAAWGVALANQLINYQDKPASELIQIIENFDVKFNDHSTFILAGKYDDGKLFYYGFKTENRTGVINFLTNELMATSPIEYLNNCVNFYLDLKDDGFTDIQCAIDTISFASKQNPKYISKNYDHIQIDF